MGRWVGVGAGGRDYDDAQRAITYNPDVLCRVVYSSVVRSANRVGPCTRGGVLIRLWHGSAAVKLDAAEKLTYHQEPRL